MRRFLFLLLRFTGIPYILRELIQRNRLTILCYHDMDPRIAEQHIRALNRLYNIIPLSAYINARRDHAATALPEKALVITFDDGHKGNYRLLSVFRQYQIPATIFLCSSIVGTRRHYWWKACPDIVTANALKPLNNDERLQRLAEFGFQENKKYFERQSLSREEITEMRATVDLQAHSRYHPILPQCTDDKSWEEIAGSKAELEKIFQLRIYAFAYPNGDYSPREPVLAKKAGYACALTIDGGYNTLDTDLFRLKRLRVDDEADLNELVVKASGLWSFFEKIITGVKDIRARVISKALSRES